MFKKILKWLFFGFVGLMVLAYFIGANMSPEEKAAQAEKRKAAAATEVQAAADQAKQAAESLETVAAAEIAKAYDGNTVAADQQFKGKTLKIKGTVADISTDFMGNPYVTMKGGVNQFLEPQFKFPSGAADQMAKLKKGQTVTFVCTGAGDVAKKPMLDDCSMVK